jgi:hypothetical protein
VGLAGHPLASLEVGLEVAVAGRDLGESGLRGAAEGGAAEPGVKHDPGGVDRAREVGSQSAPQDLSRSRSYGI